MRPGSGTNPCLESGTVSGPKSALTAVLDRHLTANTIAYKCLRSFTRPKNSLGTRPALHGRGAVHGICITSGKADMDEWREIASGRANGASMLERPNSLQEMRKAHIEGILEETGGDLRQAAQILDITPRQLRAWMTKLEIHPDTDVPDSGQGESL